MKYLKLKIFIVASLAIAAFSAIALNIQPSSAEPPEQSLSENVDISD